MVMALSLLLTMNVFPLATESEGFKLFVNVQGLKGLEPITVIVDDSATVWPGHNANLVQVERYCYFPNATKQFGYSRVSLLESGR